VEYGFWWVHGRCIHFDIGREAREVGCERAAFWRMGDLSHEGFARGPEPVVCVADDGWFGQDDAALERRGQDVEAVGNKFVYDGVPGTHQWYDGTPASREFKRVWHLEPSLTDRIGVCGAEDAALFRSKDGGRTGKNWLDCADTVRDRSAARGRRDVLAHHHSGCQRSEADVHRHIGGGGFRSDDSGATWKPINQGCVRNISPDPTAEVGHVCTTLQCISRGRNFVHAEALGCDAEQRRGDSWHEVSGNLPTDLDL